MNKIKTLFLLAALSILSIPSIAHEEKENGISYLNLTAGAIGVFDDIESKKLYGIEYRARPKKILRWKITPAFGYTHSENGAFYIYNDLKYDHRFKKHWIFTPSMGAGFFKSSDEVALGHHLEFRTSFELSRELKNKSRVGIAAYHISNSRLSNTNPGTESVVVSLSFPLN